MWSSRACDTHHRLGGSKGITTQGRSVATLPFPFWPHQLAVQLCATHLNLKLEFTHPQLQRGNKLRVGLELQQIWPCFSLCTLILISTNVFLVHKYSRNSSCKQILSTCYSCTVCFDCASSSTCYLCWVNGHKSHILLLLVPDWVTEFSRQKYNK